MQTMSHMQPFAKLLALPFALLLALAPTLYAETSQPLESSEETSLDANQAQAPATQPSKEAPSTDSESAGDASPALESSLDSKPNGSEEASGSSLEGTSNAEVPESNAGFSYPPKVTLEIGGGYLGSYVSAKQNRITASNLLLTDTQAFSSGMDLYLQSNYYLGEQRRGGITLGVGLELLPIIWDKALSQPSDTGLVTNGKNFLVSEYLALGGFYDVRLDDGDSVRFFANVGASLNTLFGGFYQGSTTYDDSEGYQNASFKRGYTVPITLPITLGARYKFDNHGVEIALKYNPLSMDYSIRDFMKTTIARPVSLSLRYVYEFQ